MHLWQQITILLYTLVNLILLVKGYAEIRRKNAFGLTKFAGIFGIFVWGDTLVISLFWILISILALVVNNWYLFLLILSLFWVVRSLGEIIYWLNEQFAKDHCNPPHTLFFYKLFQNDAVWFIYQIFWQCILVLSLLASILTSKLFLETL